MKNLILVAALAAVAASGAIAGTHSVRGYFKKDGTYVAPHIATNPNSTKTDNYSSQGNINPYNGKEGKVDPYAPKICSTDTNGSYVCR